MNTIGFEVSPVSDWPTPLSKSGNGKHRVPPAAGYATSGTARSRCMTYPVMLHGPGIFAIENDAADTETHDAGLIDAYRQFAHQSSFLNRCEQVGVAFATPQSGERYLFNRGSENDLPVVHVSAGLDSYYLGLSTDHGAAHTTLSGDAPSIEQTSQASVGWTKPSMNTLALLRSLCRRNEVDAAVARTFLVIETYFTKSDFASINEILAAADPISLHSRVTVGMLRATYRAKDVLPAWTGLLAKERTRLRTDSKNENKILRGLLSANANTAIASFAV